MIIERSENMPGPEDVSRSQPTRRIGEDEKRGGIPSQSFGSYMEKASQNSAITKPNAISPFDLSHGQTMLASGANLETLLSQVKSTNSLLGDMNSQLNTKNLKLKPSQRYILRNKLGDAVTHLRAANAKMGAEVPEELPTSTNGGIIGKFLNFISQGQAQLASAQQHIIDIKKSGDSLKPGAFLAVQLKLAHAQQSIEYASLMLAKVVDDMKMLFNVQI